MYGGPHLTWKYGNPDYRPYIFAPNHSSDTYMMQWSKKWPSDRLRRVNLPHGRVTIVIHLSYRTSTKNPRCCGQNIDKISQFTWIHCQLKAHTFIGISSDFESCLRAEKLVKIKKTSTGTDSQFSPSPLWSNIAYTGYKTHCHWLIRSRSSDQPISERGTAECGKKTRWRS